MASSSSRRASKAGLTQQTQSIQQQRPHALSHSSARPIAHNITALPDDNRAHNYNPRLEQLTREQLADPFAQDVLPGIFADSWQPPMRSSQPASPDSRNSISRSRPLMMRAQSHDDELVQPVSSNPVPSKRNSRSSAARLRTMTLESITRNPQAREQPQSQTHNHHQQQQQQQQHYHHQPSHQPSSFLGLNTSSWTKPRGRSVHDLSYSAPVSESNLLANASSRPTSRPSAAVLSSSVDAAHGNMPVRSKSDHRHLLAQTDTSIRREASPGARAKQDASIPTSWQMLQLMKLTRGKLEGHLTYRVAQSSVWGTSFCAIDAESGSLLTEATLDSGTKEIRVLVQDLRGCAFRATYDFDVRSPVIDVFLADQTPLLRLRPKSKNMFNAWFAALLCWQPVQPGRHVRRLSRKPSLAPLGWLVDKDNNDLRPRSREEPAVIKIGTMRVGTQFDGNVPDGEERNMHSVFAGGDGHQRVTHASLTPTTRWTNISCTLRENGELSLFSKRENGLFATVQLSQLSRCAIQRLHPSVLDAENCVAIYPQYARSINACSRLRPIFMSFDTRVLFEAWFVLLQAFTIPQLFGPARSLSTDSMRTSEVLPGLNPEVTPSLLRIERSISTRLSSARIRFNGPVSSQAHHSGHSFPLHAVRDVRMPGVLFAEILLDGQRKARSAKVSTSPANPEPIWAETFDFADLPSTVTTVTVRLKEIEEHIVRTHSSGMREAATAEFSIALNESEDQHISAINEVVRGETIIDIADLEHARSYEKWWPLHNDGGEIVGDVLFMVRVEQDNILMEKEYDALSQLLHNFSNGLTIRVAEKCTEEPARLASILLDIFQASGKAQEWLMYLAEEEIDGIMKERPDPRARYTRAGDSNESSDRSPALRPEDRVLLVRETIHNATSEVSVLFRGNTLMTRSLDAHMKRLGRDYLEETFGAELRKIDERDVETEVDPSRPGYSASNWTRLLDVLQRLSGLIFSSAQNCPTELRIIFRHIRSFAVDKYGDFMRSVAYTSVSSFLFLRFFVAAILHPRAFGLVNYQLKPKTLRTHTLIAKGLASLANMSTLGPKENFMEPMNQYIKQNRDRFKAFIDDVCGVDSDITVSNIPPSYSTPLQIYSRLPKASREGFLSLPHLLDRGRSFSRLVNHWLEHSASKPQVGVAVDSEALATSDMLDPELQRFHDLCLSLRQKTTQCYETADRRERRSSTLSQRWVELAEKMEETPGDFWVKRSRNNANNNGLADAIDIPPSRQPRNGSRSRDVSQSPNRAATNRRENVPISGSTPLSRSIRPDDDFNQVGGGQYSADNSAGEGFSRCASPLQNMSSGESSDVEGVDPLSRSRRRSKSKDRDRSGWGLFSRRKKEKKKAAAAATGAAIDMAAGGVPYY